MKKKKTLLIVLIIVILLALAGSAVAAVYFLTDMLRPNDELFAKYASQISDLDDIFVVDNLEQQKNLKEQNSYTSTGNLVINIQNGTTQNKKIEIATNTKYDINTNRSFAEGTIKNGQEELAKISYINSDNVYAIKSENVYENYIGIRNAGLKALATTLGMPQESVALIPDSIQVEEISEELNNLQLITEQDDKYLSETYYQIIKDVMTSDKYTKTEKTNITINGTAYEAQGYTLTITGEDIRTILINVLTKVQSDSETLRIINNVFTNLGIPEQQIQSLNIPSAIQSVIDELQTASFEGLEFKITAYESEGKLVRIELSSSVVIITLDIAVNTESQKNVIVTLKPAEALATLGASDMNIQLSIDKTILDSGINYNVAIISNINGEVYTAETNTSIGNVVNNSIYNTSEVTVTMGEETVTSSYETTLQATTEPVEIQELTNSNTVIVNNYTMEQLSPFMTSVFEKYGQVFQTIVTKLNLSVNSEAEALDYSMGVVGAVLSICNASGVTPEVSLGGTLGMYISAFTNSIFNQVSSDLSGLMTGEDPLDGSTNSGTTGTGNNTTNGADNSLSNLNSMAAQAFNSKFLNYQGVVTGTQVKSLFDVVASHNRTIATDASEMVSIQFNGTMINAPTDVSSIREQANANSTYTTDFDYDAEGKITVVKVTENVNQ